MSNSTPAAAQVPDPTVHFFPEHQDYLTARAVPLDVAAAAGLRSVTGDEAQRLLARGAPVPSDGIAIPYPGVTPAYHRIRFSDADSVGARYLAPAGRDVPVYVPPVAVKQVLPIPASLQRVLVVVESPVKALALMAAGMEAVGLGGTGTTLTEKNGKRRLNASWSAVSVTGRDVVVCFDAGRATNPNVARDEARLALALRAAGAASVRVASLPLLPGDEDQGPDDYIAAHGAAAIYTVLGSAVPADPVERITTHTSAGNAAADLLDDLPFMHSVIEATPGTVIKARDEFAKAKIGNQDFNRAVKAAKAAAQRESHPKSSALGDDLDVVGGRICKTPGGPVPLCNFDARIVEERVLDDGIEKQRKLVIAGTLDNGVTLPRVVIEPDDLAKPLWPIKAWGTVAQTANITGVTDKLRLALQIFSNPVVHTAFSHTGWRALTDATGVESGLPVFLHANGAIGAADVSIELADNLGHYALPAEPKDVAEAVRTSLKLLELGSAQVMFTLLALTYRAPLQSLFPADFSAFFHGKTGSFKTTVSLLGTAHFGAGLSEKAVTSFEASVAHIEMVLHQLKDTLALVDDFKPASTHPKDDHQVKARHVFSSVGNQEGRGRQRPDGSTRPARPPRALVFATGETIPVGESTVARLLPVPLAKGDVSMPKLTKAQANVEALPHAMSAYLHYLRPRLSDLKRHLKQRHAELRVHFRKAGEGAHLRSPSALAHAALGLEMLWPFAVEVGALTAAEAKDREQEGLEQLEALYANAKGLARETDPAQRFLDHLREKIAQGAFLLNQNPAETLANRRGESSAIGEWIGWHDHQFYYLLGKPTYSAVVRALPKDDSMPLGEVELWRRLRDHGLIESGDRDGRLTRRKMLGGERLDVIVMKKSVLFPDDDGPDDGSGGRGRSGGGGAYGSGTAGLNARDATREAGGGTDAADYGKASADRTSDKPNRTGSEYKRTTDSHSAGTGDNTQPADILTSSRSEMGPLGPVGTVGTVEKEEKSRERLLAVEGEQGEEDVRTSVSLLPGAVPTEPAAHAATSGRASSSSSNGAGSSVRTGRDQLDQNAPKRVVVADGLAYLRHQPVPAQPLFCLKTAKRLLGEEPVVAGDYTRHRDVEGRLRAAGLARIAELEFDLLPVIAGMEKVGVGVDVDAWTELVRCAEGEVASHGAKLAAAGVGNLNDDVAVRATLARRGINTASTSWKALAGHIDDPVVAALVRCRRAKGFLDSVGRALLQAARASLGRVHGSFDPLAAPTGRMSCSKPNLLAIPKNPAYRRAIIPRPGHVFVVADYAAIELRVLAELTKDEALTRIFLDGGDPHAATAATLLQKDAATVTKEERQRAKAVNFGFAFGMGPAKFIEYAFGGYGLTFTPEEAAETRAAFLTAYPAVAVWQRRTREEMPVEVRTASGRRRRFASAAEGYCERLNTPVQGTAADALKLAMVLLHARLDPARARLVLAVHDELLVEVLDPYAAEVQTVVEQSMVDGLSQFIKLVPVKVESSIRRTWAE